jgi:hypothetical protein
MAKCALGVHEQYRFRKASATESVPSEKKIPSFFAARELFVIPINSLSKFRDTYLILYDYREDYTKQ